MLAAAQGPEIDKMLDKPVVVMTPGANPDGINRFATWVNTSRSLTDVSDLKNLPSHCRQAVQTIFFRDCL